MTAFTVIISSGVLLVSITGLAFGARSTIDVWLKFDTTSGGDEGIFIFIALFSKFLLFLHLLIHLMPHYLLSTLLLSKYF